MRSVDRMTDISITKAPNSFGGRTSVGAVVMAVPAMAVTGERVFTTWVTSLEGVDHAVTDEEFSVRLIENRGTFIAVCGAVFLPGAMEGEPGPQCVSCVGLLQRVSEAFQRIGGASDAPKSPRGLFRRRRQPSEAPSEGV